MRLGKHGTWIACGLVACGIIAAGIALDRLLGTRGALTLLAAAVATAYLIGTFAPSAPLFGRLPRAGSDGGRFSLTFDDGPSPDATPAISRMLAERGHHATFFVLGMHARAYPNVLRSVVADGHELASHGDDHRLLAFATPGVVRAQLESTEAAVLTATGRLPARLFRAPHGVRSPWLAMTARRLGYVLCGWTGSAFDTRTPGSRTIAERVSRALQPGAIILLHDADGSGRGDTRRQTVEAVTEILDEAERHGLCSVSLSSLLGLSRGGGRGASDGPGQ